MKTHTISLLTFFLIGLLVSTAQETDESATSIEIPNSKFTVDVHYGFGYRTAKISPSLEGIEYEFAKQSKKGSNLVIEAGYLLHDGLSLGLTFSQFTSKPSVPNFIMPDYYGNPFTGTMRATDRTSFIGPNANYRSTALNNRAELRAGIGMGVLTYKNSTSFDSVHLFKLQGSTFGMDLSGSFHYMINRSISIGARLGFLMGTLSKYKRTISGQSTETIKLEDEDKESLNRLDISGGIRFYL